MTDFSRVPKAVFDADLDVVMLHLKRRIPDPGGSLERRAQQLPGYLADALLFAPKISLKVMGSNVALTLLIDLFGADVVEELLREKVLEFVLWRDYVALIEPFAQGRVPFVAGSFDQPVDADPEASNTAGLAHATQLDESQRKRILRLATENTSTTQRARAEGAWQALLDAHVRGDLASVGLPPSVPLSSVTQPLASGIVNELARVHHATEIIARELDLYESPATWQDMLRLASEVNSSRHAIQTGEVVLREDRAPSAGALFSANILTPSDILTLRRSSEAKAFREWLWTRPDPADSQRVIDEYRRVIVRDHKDLDRNAWYRWVRIAGVSITSSAAASKITAVTGGGFAVDALTGFASGWADDFLQRVKSGRSPRRLSQRLRDLRD